MNQTVLSSASLSLNAGLRSPGLGAALRSTWQWLVREQQLAEESFLVDDFEDTQWEETQWVSGQPDVVPVIRFRAV
jgi:hypothetical protein